MTPLRILHTRLGDAREAALAMACILVVGFLDLFLPPELGLSPFYAIFIYWAARRSGWGWGILAALLSTFVWLKAEQRTGALYPKPWALYWNTGVRLCFFAIVVYLARIQSRLTVATSRSNTDALTGLLNRRGFMDRAKHSMELCRRNRHPMTLLYADCDRFKRVNDTLGHAAGNLVLKAVGQVISQETRDVDAAARLGGDEFCILMPETNNEQARQLVERIRSRLSEAMTAGSWPVTFSMGLVTYHNPPREVHEALREADRLMYRAKAIGQGTMNCAVFADEVAS